MSKPILLFVAEGISLAHIGRTLTLASSLDVNKFNLHYACDRRFQYLIPTHFQFHHLHTNASKVFEQRLSIGAPLYSVDEVAAYVQEDLALLRFVKPDLVISDFRLSLTISARQMKIPLWSICNAHWSPDVKIPFPLPELRFYKMVGWRMSSLIHKLMPECLLSWGLRAHAKGFIKNALQNLNSECNDDAKDIRSVYVDGDKTLFVDSDRFVPLKRQGINQAFIGPVLWEPSVNNFVLDSIFKDRAPIVYVTLGSSGSIEVNDTIVEAFNDWPGTVYWASAGRFQRELPSHIKLFEFLPARQLIPHCDFVVCNGGSGTAYQALTHGVPVLGIISNVDQAWTMAHIEAQSAGLGARVWDVSAPRLRSMMQRLTKPAYRRGAIAIRDDFQRFNAKEKFAEMVNQWIIENS